MPRNLALDYLKMGLAISIVFLHTLIFYDLAPLLGHSLVQGLFRLAVPVFLIISGYYFFCIQDVEKYKKWLFRIAGLYLLWTLFYAPIWWTAYAFYNWLNLLYGYFVLWYLVGVLLGGSLLYVLRKCHSGLLLACALLLFLGGWAIQELGNLHVLNPVLDRRFNFAPWHRNFLLVSFPFLTVGFLLRKHREQITACFRVKLWHVVLAFTTVLMESIANYYWISKTEAVEQMLSLFVAAPLLFLYVLQQKIMGNNKELANLSTAIFFIHPLFIYLLKNHFIGQQTLLSFMVLLCSILAGFVLVALNKKLKYVL